MKGGFFGVAALAAAAFQGVDAASHGGNFAVAIEKFDSAGCAGDAAASVAVKSGALAYLVSDGVTDDIGCFGAGTEGSEVSLRPAGDGSGRCFVKVYEEGCGGKLTYEDFLDATPEATCMEMPEGFAKVSCYNEVADVPSAIENKVQLSAADGADAIKALTRPQVEEVKVQASLTVSGDQDIETFDAEGFKKALGQSLNVPADLIDLIVSALPLNGRKLLAGDIYLMYSVPVADEDAAAALESQINEDPAALAETIAANAEELGLDLPADILEVQEATTAEGICGNLCQEPVPWPARPDDFWEMKRNGEVNSVLTLGPAMYGVPRLVPSNNFEEYEGSFDIANVDYLQSAAFMGIAGYVLAILSLLAIVLNIFWQIIKPFCSLICKCCCKNKPKKEPKPLTGWKKYAPKFFMFLFTLIACLGAFLIYAGGPKLMSGFSEFMDVIEGEVDILDSDSEKIASAFNVAADNLDALEFLREQGDALKSAIDEVDAAIDENKENVAAYIEQANLLFIILACVFLGVAFVTTLAGECGWLFLLRIFKFVAHLLTVAAWIMFGISTTTAVVMSDLCDSMEAYLVDPATSSLDSLMPCLDPKTAVETMNSARAGITDAMDEIQGPGTAFGTMVAMNNRLYGNVQPLCEPFMRVNTGEQCRTDPADWRMYEEQLCMAFFDNEINARDDAFINKPCEECCTPLFRFEQAYGNLGIPEEEFQKAVEGVTAADALRVAQPPIEALLSCSFVQRTFTGIVYGGTCENFNGGLELFYAGMLLIGLGYTLLWITWNIADNHIKHGKVVGEHRRNEAKEVEMA